MLVHNCQRTAPRMAGLNDTRGVAMLEALFAVLVLCFGILILVALLGFSTKAQSAAKYRGDATNLATEVISLAWIDKPNIASYATNSTSTCSIPSCAAWLAKVSDLLPHGTASVSVIPATGVFSVQISWTPPGDSVHSYAVSTSIN